MRQEKDMLGARELPEEALFGIHSLRAMEHFKLADRSVKPALIHAYGLVKKASLSTIQEMQPWPDKLWAAISSACDEMSRGDLDEHCQLDALQGGAGTSTHMNVNEVLCNRALNLAGHQPGQYDLLHPIDDINRWQSTNDTYPTALKVAVLFGLQELEKAVIGMQEACQEKEQAFAHIVKVGRTEMQDAVLTTMGRTMGAYAEAFNRDRWRIYKCNERLRVIQLGGTAIGSGLGAPRSYIFKVTDRLNRLTGLSLARAENMTEATQNADVYAEVSGILNACAVNLDKVANDLRFMSSGPTAGIGELILPAVQAGSSIMPGKVNPVIPEAVLQAAMRVYGNQQILTQACGRGHLELNPFLPLVADCLLDNVDMLTSAVRLLHERCVAGLQVNEEVCRAHVENSTAVLTALLPALKYSQLSELAARHAAGEGSIRKLVVAQGCLTDEQFNQLTSAEAVTRLGTPEYDAEDT